MDHKILVTPETKTPLKHKTELANGFNQDTFSNLNISNNPSPKNMFGANDNSEYPIYVNPKQFNRIIKRREQRVRLNLNNSNNNFVDKMKQFGKGYKHESRHKHALRRPRSASGRFLKKEEIEKLKLTK